MDRIDEAAERFARALSDCVNPVLPEGFKVIADSMELVISSPVRGLAAGGYDVRQFFDPIEAEPDGDDEPSQLTDDERADDLVGRLASGIEAFLGTLADDVSEALTVPWPQEKHARHPSMALPFAVVRQRRVRFGFGRSDDPTIDLGELDLGAYV